MQSSALVIVLFQFMQNSEQKKSAPISFFGCLLLAVDVNIVIVPPAIIDFPQTS